MLGKKFSPAGCLLVVSFAFATLPAALAAQDFAPEVELGEARELVQAGRFDEAIARLKELALRRPPLPGVARELAIAYYRQQKHAQAIPLLERALEENPDDREAIQLLGLAYFMTGKPRRAIPRLEQVRSWYSVANVDANYVLGVAYVQTKDFDRARETFAEMYSLAPDSAASHLLLARMLLRQGFDPHVEREASQAAEIDPELPGAHLLLGELYMFKSRIPEAIAEFEKEMALNPAHAAIYYKLADAYTRVQKFEEAQRFLQRSIWLDQTASGPFVLMGKVLLKKGEPDLAVGMLRQALKMDPNNVMGHHLLGQAYQKLGKKKEARRELKIAQELQSAQPGSR